MVLYQCEAFSLLQWLHLGGVTYNLPTPKEQILALIELARLAEHCNITKLKSELAQSIKGIIIKTRSNMRHDGNNTLCLTSQHIASAVELPNQHSVRLSIAHASVEAYLWRGDFGFAKETRQFPAFGSDLHQQVRPAITTNQKERFQVTFRDPINRVPINHLALNMVLRVCWKEKLGAISEMEANHLNLLELCQLHRTMTHC